MSKRSRVSTAGGFWSLVVIGALFATTIPAGALTAGALVHVPDQPLGGRPVCNQLVAQSTAMGSVNYPDSEVEPHVAVDPTDPNHLIASFQQDRWNDGG